MASISSANHPLQRALRDKLSNSGLDPSPKSSDRLRLHLVLHDADSCPAALPLRLGGFVIPYFDLDGKPTGFYRYRYLEQPPAPTGFAALVETKPLRYTQPPDTGVAVYVPPLRSDWRAVAANAKQALIITEGELKAACACAHLPYPALGLGGVWSFRERKGSWLHVFDEFDWTARPVYIVYDSDAATNHHVRMAENALARELSAHGAVPYVVRLPSVPDLPGKTGLDDFVVARGGAALESLLAETEPWASAAALHELNEEVTYVRDPGLIVRLDTGQRLAPQAFVNHAYSTRSYVELVETNAGTKRVVKRTAKEWLQWPGRAEVTRITYAPGAPRFLHDTAELNMWPGWGVEPVPGDITPWVELLDFIFTGAPRERAYFERWAAYPLQHPGTKLFTSAVIWGRQQGTGKSLLGYTLMKIYGKNATEITDDVLTQSHNEWAENKQFVVADEITGGDKRSSADRMKSMITRHELRLNPKYIPAYTVPDRINYYFTSNHPDSFFLEDDDRRFFVHEVDRAPAAPVFYARYDRWAGSRYAVGAGIRALFAHLLELDLGDFNPNAAAPMTDAKRDMMELGRSDLGSWVSALRADPDSVLRAPGGGAPLPYALWRAKDLLYCYDPDGRGRVTVNGLARELRRQGVPRAYKGMPLAVPGEGGLSLWLIRDVDRLLGADGPELVKRYQEERQAPTTKAGGKRK